LFAPIVTTKNTLKHAQFIHTTSKYTVHTLYIHPCYTHFESVPCINKHESCSAYHTPTWWVKQKKNVLKQKQNFFLIALSTCKLKHTFRNKNFSIPFSRQCIVLWHEKTCNQRSRDYLRIEKIKWFSVSFSFYTIIKWASVSFILQIRHTHKKKSFFFDFFKNIYKNE